jgi:hypothetical protein
VCSFLVMYDPLSRENFMEHSEVAATEDATGKKNENKISAQKSTRQATGRKGFGEIRYPV